MENSTFFWVWSRDVKRSQMLEAKVEATCKRNKNSSIDEISERELFCDDIAHVLQNTKKENLLLRLAN